MKNKINIFDYFIINIQSILRRSQKSSKLNNIYHLKIFTVFMKLDKDNSNSLDHDELKEYMMEAMGDDFS